MEKNPPPVSRNRATHEVSGPGPTSNKMGRLAVDDDGDMIECSGKYCRSCAAGLIGECVAVCCCPCAVVHCFALAFVKAPWMMGRRCLGLGKKKGEKAMRLEEEVVLERKKEGSLRKGWVDEGMVEIVSGFVEADEIGSGNASYEAEKVLLELHQIGHLGFGRVSFADNWDSEDRNCRSNQET